MEKYVIDLLLQFKELSILISILLNTLISIFGFLPSVFLTAANLTVFGFSNGTIISFAGEVLGAIVAFWLYRKGFKQYTRRKLKNNTLVKKLLSAKGKDAFFLIIAFRFLPFMPSGLVTFVAAISEVEMGLFVLASSIGKVPALLIEAYSVYQITNWTLEGKIICNRLSFLCDQKA